MLRPWRRIASQAAIARIRVGVGVFAARASAAAGVFATLCAVATPASAQYSAVWGDEFTGTAGSAPNPTYWTYDLGNNFGNGEIDWATDSRQNSYLDGNGHLVIKVIDNGATASPRYTSAHLKTEGLVPVGPYGQIEASIQTPGTDGIGEAFWALGWNYPQVGWPACGEIDIMESHGSQPNQSNGTIHGINYADYGISAPYVNAAPLTQAFHTYGMYWAPYHIQFYLDGHIYSDLDISKMAVNENWAFNQPIYLINGVGVGGVVAGNPDTSTIFPQYEYTDYIHWNHWTAGAPAAPSGLTGQATSNSVTLSWSPSATSGVTYDVYMNTANSFAAGDLNTLEEYAVTGTGFTAYALQPGTTYYFQVRAQTPGGESGPTNTFSITTSPRGSSGPVYINCGGFGVGNFMKDTAFAQSGNPANSPFDTFSLSGVTSPAPNNVYMTYRWGPASYAINDLNANTLYTVRLHFCEDEWTSAGARIFNAFLNGNPVLKNLDVFATAGGLGKPLIYQYTAMSDANGNIQVDTTVGSRDQPEISAIEVIPNFGTNGLPGTPTGLTASGVSSNQIALSWNAVSGATGYNVFRSLTSNFTPSAASYAGTVTGTSLTDNVLYTGTTYYYKVAALNAAGQGQASAQASGTTQAGANGTIAGVDCGGAASGAFAADQNFSNGATNTFSHAIDTTALTGAIPAQTVLQTDREGNFSYTFGNLQFGRPVTVTLYFMENYWSATGSRIFNVTLNGTTVLSNFDIYSVAGAKYKAIQKSFTTYVDSNGQITLNFAPSKDNAQCSAILLTQGTSPAIPSAPAAAATALATGAIMVNWPAGDASITGYNLYRSTTPGGEGATPTVAKFSGTTFIDTGLTDGKTYYYRVSAVNYSGASPLSAEVSATPNPWPIPGTVQSENFNAGGEGVGYHSTASSNQGGQYRPTENVGIEKCSDTGGGYNIAYIAAGQWMKYTVNVQTAGTYQVSFRVAGYGGGPMHIEDAAGNNLTGEISAPNNNGWQTWSSVTATLTLPAGVQTLKYVEDGANYNINYMTFTLLSTVPAAPTGVKATAGDTTATVTWNAVSGATSYSVYRGTAPGAERATAWKTGITNPLFTNTGLTDGTTYYYKVTAVNGAGESPMSAEVAVTPQAATAGVPAAPTNVVATAGSTTATITWTPPSGTVTSYNVYRGTSPGAERATAWKTGITKPLFTNTGLTNGTTYYYKVTAVNSAGESPMSVEVSVTPE